MKKILFITLKMGSGGVEKALLNVLKLIDKSKIKAEVMLIEEGGELRNSIPSEVDVHIYNCPQYVKSIIRNGKITDKEDCSRAKRFVWGVLIFGNHVCTKILKRSFILRVIHKRYTNKNIFDNYDMVVDFHGYGNYTSYLVAKTDFRGPKVSWIHEQTIYPAYKYIVGVYKKFNKIFGCSKDCCENFIKEFPQYKKKIETYYNYLDVNEIIKKASLGCPKELDIDKFKIVSVGRVTEQKQYIKAIEVAEIMKNRKMKFKWIIVGDGDQYVDLTKIVEDKGLNSYIQFVGYKENPYPYIKNADLYVQTSRAEGYCTTISEAIILGKAVVSTDVGGIKEQLDNDKGGVITTHDSKDIAETIMRLINSESELEQFTKYNRSKKLFFEDEVEKLYKVLEEYV